MNGKLRLQVRETLKQFPNLEPELTETQTQILEFLKTQRTPKLAKTISARLNIKYDTVRARLSELHNMGYVYQPNKGVTMDALPESGMVNQGLNVKKCGYLVVDPSILK